MSDAHLPPLEYQITVERGPAQVVVGGVPAALVQQTVIALIRTLRAANRACDELTPDLGIVPGGGPVPVTDDDWADEGAVRIGFSHPAAGGASARRSAPRPARPAG